MNFTLLCELQPVCTYEILCPRSPQRHFPGRPALCACGEEGGGLSVCL